ncbi:MAG: branched-chain amino acid ABC transporter substrate-binding protein [bacterium]|nr:branched-chain amino acid ABC transporter substrate-binding protein [Acidimicrobiia bacterium]MCY4650876.1 branched-chain amino acid ABC transporter substrate-binding protein [bacterium]
MLKLLPSRSHSAPRLLVAVLAVVGLAAAACGSEDTPVEYLGDGSLGTVEVAPGEAVQIRSVYTNPGDIALLGNSAEKAIVFAVEDYGTIHGFDVNLGVGLDDMCSPEGGMITGSLVIAEGDVVGVVGTNCSAAAAEASPLLTSAGLVLISPSNTAPSLTSDLAGNEGGSHFPGYYRTAHNDLIQGEAVAHFLYGEGVSSAAVVHDGGPYTMGLATAFSDAFEEHGGVITGTWEVDRKDEDLVPVLTEIAEGEPEALFFPIFFPTGGFLVEQAAEMPAFADTVLAAADGLLSDQFLSLPETEGMFVSGPDARLGDNTNQSTGVSAPQLKARLEEVEGQPPTNAFWGHAYDATVLLLDAVTAASYIRAEDSTLVIDRAGLREYLDNLSGFHGVSGILACDEFGDCGASRVVIHEHLDSTDTEATRQSVVFEAGPDDRQTRESLTGH